MAAEENDLSTGGRCFVLRPNSGYYWKTTLWVYIVLSIVTLSVALGFAFAGYWPILPFAGLELTALGAALYASARRGGYRETVRIGADNVEIEKGTRGPESSWVFDLAWSEVVLTAPLHRWYPSRLVIRSSNRVVELGAFLTDDERESLAAELRRCIGPITMKGACQVGSQGKAPG